MKTFKFTIIIALCSVIIYGCSKKSATFPHLVAVPENAAIVLSFNAKQIVEKAELNKIEQYRFYSLLEQEFDRLPAKSSKIVKDFVKDTRTSGLNLDNIFVYISNGNTDTDEYPLFYFGITVKIENLKTFENFLGNNDLIPSQIEDRFIDLREGITVQWNDEIVVISMNAVENGIDIFNKDESKSILANELFKSEYSDKNDAYLYMEYNFIIDFLQNVSAYYALDQTTLSNIDLYKDMSISASLNSEKGELVAKGKMLPAEKVSELVGKFYKTDFNPELYNYFPDKSLLAVKFAIKPLDIYNYYKKTIGIGQTEETAETTTEKVETLDEYGNVIDEEDVVIDKYSGYTHSYNLLLKMFVEQHDEKITSILESFTGDFIGSMLGFSNFPMPEFAVATGIVEGKENAVINLIKELKFTENSDGYYSLNINNMHLYFAVNKNAACLATNTELIAKFLDKGYTSNITSAKDMGKEIKDALNYFYLNININDYPPLLKVLTGMSEQGRVFLPLLEKLKSISGRSANANDFELKLKFTDNDYASKIILKGIDELAAENLILQ
ncbi:MAG: DUF4836 family protein [Prevotellaceae bacterium]|jgi:hypothetical protein|nr:DUF4836 family protein [Prevotellaceae bacterium]